MGSDPDLQTLPFFNHFKGRVHCFSMQVVINKCFLLNPEKKFCEFPSCCFREKVKKYFLAKKCSSVKKTFTSSPIFKPIFLDNKAESVFSNKKISCSPFFFIQFLKQITFFTKKSTFGPVKLGKKTLNFTKKSLNDFKNH